MAKEYLLISDDQSKGIIAISTHVLEAIVSYAIGEANGVQLADASAFHNPITCRIVDKEVMIDLDVKIAYGKNVNAIAESAQEHVKQTIYQMTDIECSNITMNITGFVF